MGPQNPSPVKDGHIWAHALHKGGTQESVEWPQYSNGFELKSLARELFCWPGVCSFLGIRRSGEHEADSTQVTISCSLSTFPTASDSLNTLYMFLLLATQWDACYNPVHKLGAETKGTEVIWLISDRPWVQTRDFSFQTICSLNYFSKPLPLEQRPWTKALF